MSLVLPATTQKTNGHADYAPLGHPDRLEKLSASTVKAIDAIGEEAAFEIGQRRAEVRAIWEALDEQLGHLVDAIRGHAKIATAEVSDFTALATTVMEDVKGIQEKIAQKTGE